MWVEIVAAFLIVSIVFYAVFAGADFGAGILEFFVGRELRSEQRHLIDHAIGPVWEANHVWLILAVVILFNGFPHAYAEISTLLHIPITLMLVGVILRGCAFTFRHYDAVRDGSRRYYATVFRVSSVLTPFMLGVIAAGASTVAERGTSFYAIFVARWCTPFAFALGVFTCSLFAFLAAVYLIGEASDAALRAVFKRRARILNVVAVAVGALVFVGARLTGVDLLDYFMHDIGSVALMAAATAFLAPLWWSVEKGHSAVARVVAAAQVTCVLLGWFKLQYPFLIAAGNAPLERHGALAVHDAAAPDEVLRILVYALVGGCALIAPALFFLLRVMKTSSASHEH